MLLVDARIRSDEGLIEELPMYAILNLKLGCCGFRGLSRLGILRILTPSLFGFVLSPLCSRLEEDTYFREMKLGADLARYLSLRKFSFCSSRMSVRVDIMCVNYRTFSSGEEGAVRMFYALLALLVRCSGS